MLRFILWAAALLVGVVVALLTGHMLKDPEIMLSYHRDMVPTPPFANRSIEIDATLADMERVLRNVPVVM